MFKIAPLLLSLSSLASGQLIITEIMSSSRHDLNTINGDWLEITNTGTATVNMNGLSFADSLLPADRSVFPSHDLAAGESLLVLRESDTASLAAFRQTWQIPANIRIFLRTEFAVEPSGLSSNGETVYLFDPSGNIVDQFQFGPATSGLSFARLRDGGLVPGAKSTSGEFGAIESMELEADTGSPGFAAAPASPLPPEFLGIAGVSLIAGTEISTLQFPIQVNDPNTNDTLSLSILEGPDWLTLGAITDGSAPVSGTPSAADVGENLLVLELSDGVAETADIQRTYRFYVNPTSSPIILNEFNAVDDDEFLGGEPDVGETGSEDSFFGRVLGNGGNWVEFVITGDGGPSLVNASGWTIEIGSVEEGVFTPSYTRSLNDDPFWKDLPSGTILTFSSEATDLNRGGDLAVDGFQSANVNFDDPNFLDGVDDNPAPIGPSNTAIRILDENGMTLFGPAGEGIGGLEGIGNTEILELEDDPAPTITGLSVEGGGLDGYDPGSSSSTFGSPNLFADAADLDDRPQNFDAFIGTSLQRWQRTFNITDATSGSDTDGDGFSDASEFLFGGDPTNGNSFPMTLIGPSNGNITFDVRIDDTTFPTPRAERSPDLQNWVTTEFPMVNEIASPLGTSYLRRTYQFEGTAPRMFFRIISPMTAP